MKHTPVNFLNVGCGSIFHPAWVNIDMLSTSPSVRAHDLRKGLPYPDCTFHACYSSHVLEHLRPAEARLFVAESLRVLKRQGVIRIVVPDLEAIAVNYLRVLQRVESGVIEEEPDYDWMMLELYDQTVRSFSGGEMGRYLADPELKNKAFIASRIGMRAEQFWVGKDATRKKRSWSKVKNVSWLLRKCRNGLVHGLAKLVPRSEAAQSFEEGLFRNSGEIHRWMYDRFSLRRMLERAGFTGVRVCRADESSIPDFGIYELDAFEGQVRKPESLFMEGIKP